MATNLSRGMDRRRSQRITLSTPVNVQSLDPLFTFDGRCYTVDVSSHGCRLIAPRSFQPRVRLRLIILPNERATTARVIRSVPVLPASLDTWDIGVELDIPGDYWDVQSPPSDWIKFHSVALIATTCATLVSLY